MNAVSSVQTAGNTQGAGGGGDRSYFVRPGDSLWAIARQHGVSLQALEAANPQILHPDLIYSGQHINIPAGSSQGMQAYTVRSGDTLTAIGNQFGVSWQSIASANHLSNPDLIMPGQHLAIPGASGGVNGSHGLNGGGDTAGSGSGNVAAIAEKYLGSNASSLENNTSDKLPMHAGVDPSECCANFVSAVLTEAGQLPANLHTDSVAQLNQTLRSRGWTAVSPSEAKPGDVVIMQGGGISHTEIVSGKGEMIGSNNINADGTQQVSHNPLSYALSHGGVILRAPGGTNNGGGTGRVDATGQGSHSDRIDQAMHFFEGQGWSKAQAAGIVANLDAESGLRLVAQNGGGPGFGLAQWEGPRQATFKAWAGHDIHQSTFQEQLEFVQHELKTSEASAGRALANANDARSAGSIVTQLYERPADIEGQAASRGQRAVEIYNSSK